MKKNKISGWKQVFSFTFTQTAASRSFKSSAIFLGIIILASMIGINVYSAMSGNHKEDTSITEQEENQVIEESKNSEKKLKEFAKTVYYQDETGLQLSMEDISAYMNKSYKELTFEAVNELDQDIETYMENADKNSVFLHMGFDDSGILVSVYLPKDSEYSKTRAEKFGDKVVSYVERFKKDAMGLSEEQIDFMNTEIAVRMGDKEQLAEVNQAIKNNIPTALCLVLYMLIVLFAQMVATSVATEKTSKVMELLLTSIRPLAVIVGKVFSMMALALTEIAGGIALLFAGNAIGTMIGQKIDADYTSIVVDALKQYDILDMISPVKIIVALVVFILGFTFYCVLGGLVGATVNRGEDLSSAMSAFSVVAIIGFMLSYISVSMGSISIKAQIVAALIPISSPFILPAKILVGGLSTNVIVIGSVILLITVVVFVTLVAKVYEAVILYSGNKIKLKDIRTMYLNSKVDSSN